ncbi:response regulator transcription factor [Zhihengliuella salsuginis]|uniref:Transcriptional regulatory protein n=1 Tax=Zhihengliuella salsuginis TaxID=578222 RepID=A0ABQ3GB64_9MICC|nr:response regulator [Zhihengliuella salsuginis]GHD00371.1 transcriptional regulatory protein [Zhihengliuella salsuginis]
MTDQIRTLIVDDDPDVLRMHQLFVESLDGFAVAGTAARAAEVVPAMEADPGIGLVLLDVHLPDGNGVDVLTELRARFPRAGVVMITAAAEAETVRAAIGRGIDGYLVKPFTVDDFRGRLAAFRAARAQEPGRLAQAEIDALMGGTTTAPPAAVAPPAPLPKGFSQPTLELVASAVRAAAEDVSAAQVAQTCGISRVSARRYLDLLTRRGEAELRPRYGSAGRPEHRYRWIKHAGA